jgi:filamentous hemagglutinin family protein
VNQSYLSRWILMGSFLSLWLCAAPIAAQVIPDATLPVGERSQVSGNPNAQIQGGARRGDNLFHSFSQFSIPTGGSAFFNNAAEVQNIFARVTGRSASEIDGMIRANGTANLFVLNPNGIIFGRNASLNVGGSFVATTARAIGFTNGEMFNSDGRQPLPSQLLTVSPNAFFFNQVMPQPIVNRSSFNDTGLQVPPGQNLLLIGGAVQLRNGRLISPGSFIELGGVSGAGTVDLSADLSTNSDWHLNIPDHVTRANVFLRNDSDINVKGSGGSIRLLARNIGIDDSSLRIEIPEDSRSPETQTGDLNLNASGSIAMHDSVLANSLFGQGTMGSVNLIAGDRISLNGSAILNTIEETAIGNAGAINITARSLSLTEDSQLASTLTGQGNVRGLNLNVRDDLFLNASSLFNTVEAAAIGNVGAINITAGSWSLTGGGQVISGTSGSGNAGNVTINARDTVLLDGSSSDGVFASTIYTQTNENAAGRAGAITITTGSLFLTNGGALNSASTDGRGNAGRVTIQARDSVQIRGFIPNNPGNISGVFTSATEEAVGNGGNVSITTGSLAVSNRGRIITNAEGRGNAGNIRIQARDAVLFDGTDAISVLSPGAVGRGGDIDITARSLSLLNGAQFSATTSGTGNAGNINLRSPLILLRDGSSITTNATRGNIPGGNIAIDTQFLVAEPNENSDISANSEDFRGGNVSIDAASLFGIQPRLSATPFSDITATGATSALSGTIDVTTAGIDPTSGLVELPTELVDSSRLIAQGCPADQGNSFIISGQGGLAPSPEQQLDDDADWQDRRRLIVAQPLPLPVPASRAPHSPRSPAPLLEATGWQKTATGEVRLVSEPRTQAVLHQPASCSRQ